MPNFSDDEKEYTDGQKEDVVGEVAEVRVADDEGGGVVLRDDVEDAVFVGQRNEENDDKNLRRWFISETCGCNWFKSRLKFPKILPCL